MARAYRCDQCETIDTGVPRGLCTFELYSKKERRINGFDGLELCEDCARVFAGHIRSALTQTDGDRDIAGSE